MKEVGVDLLDSAGQLGRQHAGLSEAAQTVGRQVAPEVAQEGTPGSRVAGAAPRPPPAAQHPQRLLVEVLRQIADRRPDFVVHRMARSEEHTSELQSLMRISYAVFCLKKKKENKP